MAGNGASRERVKGRALRHQVDGRAAIGDVGLVVVAAVGRGEGGVRVLDRDEVGAIVRDRVVARDKGARALAVRQVRVGVGEPRKGSLGARPGVDEDVVLRGIRRVEHGGGLDGNAPGEEGSASVHENVHGTAGKDIAGGAILVEDVAGAICGRRQGGDVQASADMYAFQYEAADRRAEVFARIRHVGNQSEAGRLRRRRVMRRLTLRRYRSR